MNHHFCAYSYTLLLMNKKQNKTKQKINSQIIIIIIIIIFFLMIDNEMHSLQNVPVGFDIQVANTKMWQVGENLAKFSDKRRNKMAN